MLMDVSKDGASSESDGMFSQSNIVFGFIGLILGIILVPLVMGALNKSEEAIEVEHIKWNLNDSDVDAVVEQELNQ